MSRIGKKPIDVPKGVTVQVASGFVAVKGPKGELKMPLSSAVEVAVEGAIVKVSPVDEERQSRALQGTTRAVLANMIQGVSKGYEKKLEVNGVGYEVEVKGNSIVLKLGFNRPVRYQIPPTVTVEAPTVTSLVVRGMDLQQVGAVASEIRKLRKPEPYKGKGIKYAEEVIRRKAGKAFASGGS